MTRSPVGTGMRDMSEDDAERIACDRAGQAGHRLCGVCDQCRHPRFECGHILVPEATR